MRINIEVEQKAPPEIRSGRIVTFGFIRIRCLLYNDIIAQGQNPGMVEREKWNCIIEHVENCRQRDV